MQVESRRVAIEEVDEGIKAYWSCRIGGVIYGEYVMFHAGGDEIACSTVLSECYYLMDNLAEDIEEIGCR